MIVSAWSRVIVKAISPSEISNAELLALESASVRICSVYLPVGARNSVVPEGVENALQQVRAGAASTP